MSIPLVSYTPDQMTQLIEDGDPGNPAGPQIDVTVAGIARTDLELVERTPLIAFTPAFYERYQDEVGHFDDILEVQLTHGGDALDEFERDLARIVPESEGAIVSSPEQTSAQVEDANRVLAVSSRSSLPSPRSPGSSPSDRRSRAISTAVPTTNGSSARWA